MHEPNSPARAAQSSPAAGNSSDADRMPEAARSSDAARGSVAPILLGAPVRRIALAIALVAFLATLWRLQFGVDLSDEAWYLAQPYRFALGDRPFVDEVHPTQTAALLTWPLVKAWVTFTGGNSALVLAARVAWLLLSLACAAIVVRTLRQSTGSALALLVALPCIVQVPFGLPTLSYNTWASLALTAGAFLLVAPELRGGRSGRRSGERAWLAAAAGCAHAIAIIAIQTYAVSAAACCVAALVIAPRERRLARLLWYAGGAALALAPFVAVLASMSDETRAAFSGRLGGAANAWWKARTVVRQLWIILPNKAWLGALVAAFVLARVLRRPIVAAIALLALAPFLWPSRAWSSSLCLTTLAMLVAPLAYSLGARGAFERALLVGIWAPSLVAAYVAAWTSGNGIINAGFGALAGLVATGVLVARAFDHVGRARGRPALAALGLVWPLSIAALFLAQQRTIFLGDTLDVLDARVEQGPFAGLRTTPRIKGFVHALERDLESHVDAGERLLVLHHFPAGYLMSRARPATPSVWQIDCPPKTMEWCTGEMEAAIARFDPALVLKPKVLPHGTQDEPREPEGDVDRMIERRFRLVLDTPDYALFARP